MEEWRRDCHEALLRDPSFPYRGCYPDNITVNTLINALTNAVAKSNGLHAPDRAWQLLQEVVEVQRHPSMVEYRFRDVRLNPRLFNSVIWLWTRADVVGMLLPRPKRSSRWPVLFMPKV